MSRYCEVKTEFRDGRALVHALLETGNWDTGQIEVYDDPQHLIGYKGDTRPETAHIIIRQKHVGQSSNDIGFYRDDNGQYRGIISDFDKRKYGEQWINRLKGNYAFHKLRIEQESRGRSVTRTRMEGNRQRVEIRGYR